MYCRSTPASYVAFYNIYNTILFGVLIPILMFVFGLLTIRNIKLSRQRINAQTIPNLNVRNHAKLHENEVSMMTLFQIVLDKFL
jgi:hypothetical protein